MGTVARHAGKVVKGQVVFADPSMWRAAVAKQEGRQVWITLSRQSTARTMSQNRYYWTLVEEIAGYIGERREETHELLKERLLLGRTIELLDGNRLKMPATTTTLTTEEFSQYVEQVKVWSAQFLGLSLPEANRLEVTL